MGTYVSKKEDDRTFNERRPNVNGERPCPLPFMMYENKGTKFLRI